MQVKQVKISGAGMFVPDNVVTNADLEKLMDTSDDWIRQRSGIEERRHINVEGQGPAHLAWQASLKALSSAGYQASDMDMIIVASLSPEHYFPGTSVFLQRMLDLQTTPSMDLRCQCSGFLYALSVGKSLIASGQYARILLVGTEVHSRALDMTTRGRDTAVLFGDGAGAVILEEETEPEKGIMDISLFSQGEHAEKLWVEVPTLATSPHISAAQVAEGKVYPKMDGKFVFKHAVSRMPQAVNEVLEPKGLVPADVDLFLFHQANLRINEKVAQILGIEPAKTFNNIQKYGNCSAASIPMCLSQCWDAGRIKPGTLVVLSAFGSGFTWGAALIRF